MARWTKATFFGWTLGFALTLAFIAVAGAIGLGDTQFPVGLGMGAGVGFVQARSAVFPPIGRRAWMVASAAGMAAPFLLFDVAHWLPLPVEYSLPISVAVGGVLVGILQWLLLRRMSGRAAIWLIAAPVGWTLAGSTALNNLYLPRIPGIAGVLLYVGFVLLGGILLGVLGGLALRALANGRRLAAEA